MSRNVQTLMIDSGAFSVWNNGNEIDLDIYIAFCKKHLDAIDTIVALDVIPGLPGNRLSLTKGNISKACKQGWTNYMKMLDAGLPKDKVMPVFHQNDDWKWLQRFMDEGVPYFGISPANDCGSSIRQMWLDTCMKYICDSDGYPKAKFHGFAVTSIPLMLRYPWYSVDSASWMKHAVFGVVILPSMKTNGEWDYLRSPQRIFVTKPGEKAADKISHYNLLAPHTKKAVKRYFDSIGVPIGTSRIVRVEGKHKHNKDTENVIKRYEDHTIIEEIIEHGVSNDIKWRCFANKAFFDKVQELIPWPKPFLHLGKRGLL